MEFDERKKKKIIWKLLFGMTKWNWSKIAIEERRWVYALTWLYDFYTLILKWISKPRHFYSFWLILTHFEEKQFNSKAVVIAKNKDGYALNPRRRPIQIHRIGKCVECIAFVRMNIAAIRFFFFFLSCNQFYLSSTVMLRHNHELCSSIHVSSILWCSKQSNRKRFSCRRLLFGIWHKLRRTTYLQQVTDTVWVIV